MPFYVEAVTNNKSSVVVKFYDLINMAEIARVYDRGYVPVGVIYWPPQEGSVFNDIPLGFKDLATTYSPYGPYQGNSLAEAVALANAAIPIQARYQTLEVRLIVAGIGYRYWYEGGVADINLVDSAGKLKSNLDANLLRVINAGTPLDPTDLATKGYTDSVAAGIKPQLSCRLVATTNITTLSGLFAIDGITGSAEDRVLLVSQATPAQNGVWLLALGAWTRPTDYFTVSAGYQYFITSGNSSGSTWILISTGTIVVGTTPTTWTNSFSTQKVSLAAGSQGLSLGTVGNVGLLPTGDDINLSGRNFFDAEFTNAGNSKIVRPGYNALLNAEGLVATDSNKKVVFGLFPDGLYVDDINTSYTSNIPYPNNLGIGYGMQDLLGKVLFGVTPEGMIVAQNKGLDGDLNYLIDEGFRIETKKINQKSVIYRTHGLHSRQISPIDWDVTITSVSRNNIIFDSAIEGQKRSYWINKTSGITPFYTGFVDTLFKKTIWHIIGNGQSLSEGAVSTARTFDQPYDNVMFDSGIKPPSGNIPIGFMRAFESVVERGCVAGANLISGFARRLSGSNPNPDKRDIRFLISHVGYGGTPLDGLKKGSVSTTSYADAIAQVTAAKSIANRLGYGYEVLCMPFHHGENDDWYQRSQTPDYQTRLISFHNDYNNDIKAITGQTRDLMMFVTQTSSHEFAFATPSSSIANYNLFKLYPERFVLVCPKYWLSYSDAIAHLDTNGYNAMGDLVAAAILQTFVMENPWKPLYPTSISRSGAVLNVIFNVPVAPLVLDTTAVTNPGSYGLEYVNTSGTAVAISSVVLGSDGVSAVITLATATAGKLRYAYTSTVGAAPGPTTGPRGNLRDSANYENTYNLVIRNWCVHFEEDVI